VAFGVCMMRICDVTYVMYICDVYDDDDAAACVEVAKCLLDPPLHLMGCSHLNTYYAMRLNMRVPSP